MWHILDYFPVNPVEHIGETLGNVARVREGCPVNIKLGESFPLISNSFDRVVNYSW
jgi:hypothetical protein